MGFALRALSVPMSSATSRRVRVRPSRSEPAASIDLRIEAVALWPLPLVAALLPALAALVALALHTDAVGTACNPFIDDCVSISRMARHGLANHLFRALVLPGAVLQALTWLIAAGTLMAAGWSRRDVVMLAVVGLCADVALVVYGSFLGSDGAVYDWLRRWGTLMYFGGTYLAMLLFVRGANSLQAAQRLASPRLHRQAMLVLLGFIAAIGLTHLFASQGPFPALEDRIENLTEWWGGLALTLAFGLLAALWRHWALGVTIGAQPRH